MRCKDLFLVAGFFLVGILGVFVGRFGVQKLAFAGASQKAKSRQGGTLHKKTEVGEQGAESRKGKGAKTWKEPPNDYIDGYLVASTAEGEFLKLSGGQWVNATALSDLPELPSLDYGDYLLHSDDAEFCQTDYQVWTKAKEYILPAGGNLRFKFDLKGAGAGWASQGRIYRDGTPVGVVHENTLNDSYQSYSEDISGWSAGDKVQLYLCDRCGSKGDGSKGGAKANVCCRNFRIYSNAELINLYLQNGTVYWAHQ